MRLYNRYYLLAFENIAHSQFDKYLLYKLVYIFLCLLITWTLVMLSIGEKFIFFVSFVTKKSDSLTNLMVQVVLWYNSFLNHYEFLKCERICETILSLLLKRRTTWLIYQRIGFCVACCTFCENLAQNIPYVLKNLYL